METNLIDFFSGDNVDFFIINKDYNGDYNCKVIFIKDNLKYEFLGSYVLDRFNFSISTTESEKIKDNKYRVFVLFSKNNFSKTDILKDVLVKPNILTSACIETTTYNKKMLKAIEDILQGRMEDDYVSYTIGNRSITKMSPESLIKLKDYFQDLVNQEEQYNINGVNKGNKLKIRWVGRFD